MIGLLDIAITIGIVIVIACLIAVLYYAGYRHGWGVGYDAAYRSMIGDLKKGKALFWESGLEQWEIPEHWKKYQDRKGVDL